MVDAAESSSKGEKNDYPPNETQKTPQSAASNIKSSTGKTKAKKRYVKRKNNRRKERLRKVKSSVKVHEKKEKASRRKDDGSSSSEEESRSDDSDGTMGDEKNIAEDSGKVENRQISTSDNKDKENMIKSKNENENENDNNNGRTSSAQLTEKRKRDEKSDAEYHFNIVEKENDVEDTKKAKLQKVNGNGDTSRPQGVLERFPDITRPARPTQEALAELAISSEMPDSSAQVVNPSTTSSLDSLSEYISESMRNKLSGAGITQLFAVQSVVIPRLLKHSKSTSNRRSRDLCVSAPTGSGKTLAYALPIVEALRSRVLVRLRALIVLPTRDLVVQLRETLQWLIKGTDLQLGVAMGQHSLTKEQATLTNGGEILDGGSSKVDILIATPGRLMEHIKATPNFTLQHLQYLVIDEADRLLQQSFQDWLLGVLRSISQSNSNNCNDINYTSKVKAPDAVSHWKDKDTFGTPSTARIHDNVHHVQKLLFSATLTRDPSKIAELKLYRPAFIAVRDNSESSSATISNFSLPVTLKQHYIVSPATTKPLALFHLLHDLSIKNVLIFTKSVESASRLVKLVQFFEQSQIFGPPLEARVYSSDMTQSERTKLLNAFKENAFNILICSDLIARGIDLPDVDNVVNYDTPVDPRKYIHRVGRTARAGKSGDAWSLVESQEISFFKDMLKSAGIWNNIERIRLKKPDVNKFEEAYESALGKLEKVYSRDQE